MTTTQKIIKYLAIAFAVMLIVSIVGGIASALGAIGGIFMGGSTTGELKTYEIDATATITELDIEIGAADLVIKQGDAYSVKSNLKKLSVEENGGVLAIKEKTVWGGKYNGATVTVYLPANYFERIEINTGAGRFQADSLNAHKLDLELGAGEVYIDRVSIGSCASIEGGTGKLTVAFGTICNLDLDMGVGQLNLDAELYGNNELDLGVGEANITLENYEMDIYTIDVEKGIGSITVNGEHVSDYGCFGNGQSRVQINGGIGAINLNFKES